MENLQKRKRVLKQRRHKRIRSKISGTANCPRLCVFRSNKYIYAQLINDTAGKILAVANNQKIQLKDKKESKQIPSQKAKGDMKKKVAYATGKTAMAYEVGKLIANAAFKKKIKKVLFDRGGYKYHGRVKALAEGARDAGLRF